MKNDSDQVVVKPPYNNKNSKKIEALLNYHNLIKTIDDYKNEKIYRPK